MQKMFKIQIHKWNRIGPSHSYFIRIWILLMQFIIINIKFIIKKHNLSILIEKFEVNNYKKGKINIWMKNKLIIIWISYKN